MKTKLKAPEGRKILAPGNARGMSNEQSHPSPAEPGERREHIGLPPVYSFEVSVKGTDWKEIVNTTTPGRAKHEYHRRVIDAWPDVPFTAMRCRKVGAPISSGQFLNTATYRGLPGLRCGARVQVGESSGCVVGNDASANFRIMFDEDSKYHGQVLSVHPAELKIA